MDELITITDAMKAQIQQAGELNWDNEQLAVQLNISEPDLRVLLYDHPELQIMRAKIKIDKANKYLQRLQDIADNPETETRYVIPLAKFLYEMFSGHSTEKSNVNIAIQNVHPRENNRRLIEVLDPAVVDAIENDG